MNYVVYFVNVVLLKLAYVIHEIGNFLPYKNFPERQCAGAWRRKFTGAGCVCYLPGYLYFGFPTGSPSFNKLAY